MKYLLLALSTLAFSTSFSQTRQPQIEATFSPGLFAEQLSSDSLIPSNKHGDRSLGDVSSLSVQITTPLKNERWLIKGGLSFNTRHYSIRKYDAFSFLGSLFGAYSRDTFNFKKVKFTNHYIQFPLSFSYALKKPTDQFRFSAGLNIRPELLTGSKATITFDSEYNPSMYDFDRVEETYTSNASKFIITVEPFIETSFLISKNWGGLIQFRPFSIYSSDLDKRLTTATTEFFGFTFGAYFKL